MKNAIPAGFVLFFLLVSWSVPPSSAGELAGVVLPDQVRVDSRTLVLNGMGVREATILKVDVYVAGLYVEAKSSDPAAILRPDQAKRLVMKFVRAVGKRDLVKAWAEGFEKSVGASLPSLEERVATFNSWMTDMPNGGTLSFTYIPDAGVGVEAQGSPKGTIPGADFAEALFRIWLGPSPPNPGLKEGLLRTRQAPWRPTAGCVLYNLPPTSQGGHT